MKKWIGASLVGLVVVSGALAQEYGRASLEGQGLGRAPLPRPVYDAYTPAGSFGVKLGVGWASMNWDVGPAEGSEVVFVPEVGIFYKTADYLDINFSFMRAAGSDSDGTLGDNEASMMRLALGARYWHHTGTRITPYAGAGLGYYILDGDTDNTRGTFGGTERARVSVDNGPGAYVEGGVAFLVADLVSLNLEVTYDFLLGSADATINGRSEDFKASSLAFLIGVSWTF